MKLLLLPSRAMPQLAIVLAVGEPVETVQPRLAGTVRSSSTSRAGRTTRGRRAWERWRARGEKEPYLIGRASRVAERPAQEKGSHAGAQAERRAVAGPGSPPLA